MAMRPWPSLRRSGSRVAPPRGRPALGNDPSRGIAHGTNKYAPPVLLQEGARVVIALRGCFGRLPGPHPLEHARGRHDGFGELRFCDLWSLQHRDQQCGGGRLDSEQDADVAVYWCSWPQFHQAFWPAFLAQFPLHPGGDIGQRGLRRVDRFTGVFLLVVGVVTGQAGGCDGLVDSEGAPGCGASVFQSYGRESR
jgi:hypothetical protein